ncbi:unnamed protein product [Effrenium voratum]|nr:unnamed protein product [Effrenium voratum]
MSKPAVQVGDRVTVAQTQLLGTVKFLGATEFASGEWMGIALDEKAGKNNGSVKGKVYFECKPEHGLFVRPNAVTKIEAPSRLSRPRLWACLAPEPSVPDLGNWRCRRRTPPAGPAPARARGSAPAAGRAPTLRRASPRRRGHLQPTPKMARWKRPP